MEFFIVIKEEAEADLVEIFDYYEAERSGLGVRFLESFEKSLKKLKTNPFHTFNISNNIRRAVTSNFPYSIYYTIIEDSIVVFGVLHQYRKPDKIFKRLE